LAIGTLLLGMISKISDLYLTVALPNNLTGRVAITEISSEITRRAEAAALEDDDEDEDMNYDNEDTTQHMDIDSGATPSRGLPDLQSMFHVGQWVRCVVVGLESGDDSNDDHHSSTNTAKKSRKRIDLSLQVDQVNSGLVSLDLIPGFTLSATVTSFEDHGYLLDIGMSDRTAFLPRKEAQAYETQWHEGRALQAGQPIVVTIMGSSKNKSVSNRVIQVTADPQRTKQASITEALSNIQSLLPGELVTARITRVLPNGLACRVLEFFDATIDVTHIPSTAMMKQSSEHDLRQQFKVGDMVS
jgi:rRNA biogenesis protein RRP5